MRSSTRLAFYALFLALAGPSEGRADKVVLVAGGGRGGDGSAATQAKLTAPFGVAFGPEDSLYLVEMTGNRLRRIDARGVVTTLAGTGTKGHAGDGGPAARAELNGPHSLVVAPDGSVLVADTWNNRVRRIDPRAGTISTLAGTGEKGFDGDGGLGSHARFGGVYCAALGPRGERLYLADLDNRRVRAVDLKTGTVTTVAGNGKKGVPKDGALATEAPLVDPRAVAVDRKGNLYILERSGHALRVVDAQGRIRTVAGTGKPGADGDGGPALQATLNGPKHLCIDRDDGVLIADTENHLIRKYLPADGTILRVAGTGKKGSGGVGGPPERVELNQPHGIHLHPSGDLFIADSSNHRVLRIERKR